MRHRSSHDLVTCHATHSNFPGRRHSRLLLLLLLLLHLLPIGCCARRAHPPFLCGFFLLLYAAAVDTRSLRGACVGQHLQVHTGPR